MKRTRFEADEDAHRASISEMLGKTMVKVERGTGRDSEMLRFVDTNGTEYIFYHDQGCCEEVEIESIEGKLDWLVGLPIAMAEAVSSEGVPAPTGAAGTEFHHEPESYTWTFYKFGTMRGTVVVRWLGTSNGYYSEEVSFKIVEEV